MTRSFRKDRLVILDEHASSDREARPEKPTSNHVLSSDLAAAELQATGFRLIHREDVSIANPDSESAHSLIAVGRP